MSGELRIICSPIEKIDGIEAFIVNICRDSLDEKRSLDRISVQMPGHFVLKNVGFEGRDEGDIMDYIDSNLPALVDLALDRTEAIHGYL